MCQSLLGQLKPKHIVRLLAPGLFVQGAKVWNTHFIIMMWVYIYTPLVCWDRPMIFSLYRLFSITYATYLLIEQSYHLYCIHHKVVLTIKARGKSNICIWWYTNGVASNSPVTCIEMLFISDINAFVSNIMLHCSSTFNFRLVSLDIKLLLIVVYISAL